jgi:hypothetical protein
MPDSALCAQPCTWRVAATLETRTFDCRFNANMFARPIDGEDDPSLGSGDRSWPHPSEVPNRLTGP